ncbi:OLC1v1027724C1 [Oldenlandia corymbosa var. corymbosa]|uniref:OLC1v1027724C1 n=1 Tax=Oldenlandia corymbosa var. corymbosa TaxID=529605 RepID=A0AAV1CAE1_OLDCO|nr:OLC1v1027724C1 [Oldenlandia corymbosa var. corymbosa]
MVGKEDAPYGGDNSGGSEGGLQGPCQFVGGRKLFWRSASWSSSRTSLPPLNPHGEKEGLDPSENSNSKGGQGRKISGPLTPRSQNSFKNRSCLPPLQPLSIARRSLDEWPKAGSDDIGEWPLPSTPSGRDATDSRERLKLDLSSIQKNVGKNGGLVKREKIAFFDKECSKVAEHVYLGGDAVARDRDILKQHGITHILNCVGFVCPEYFKTDFVYRTLWLQDSPTEDITSILYDVFDYFEDVREQGGRVFVHCCQGVSRSTSLVIAYLMWREGQSFDDAFQYVKAARGIADPNMGFACQLLQCQKRVHAFPLSPSSLVRMYRIAPHSPYDPLHLVPKMLNDPSPSALDSRGAFIVHIPSAIYVWIGKKCDMIMERDARGAACQIVRYEKVQGPVVMIKDGEEPLYFWDAFSSLLPLMEKSNVKVDAVDLSVNSCPGERKVESYSIDFEIFQKAILGGFVPPFASSESELETRLPARGSSWSALRCKFISGNMKDFVFASNSGPSIVYPDSTYVVEEQCPSKEFCSSASSFLTSMSSLQSSSSPSTSSLSSLSSSSTLSSSSSPPYLSPDSFSSEASCNSTSFSDSPVLSPSTTFCSGLTSSVLSNFSNMNLLPSKVSPHSVSKSSKFIDVNFSSESCLKTASTPAKKCSLSIAERRGSLSKFLKLPMLTDDSQGKDIPINYLPNEFDVITRNGDASSLDTLHEKDSLQSSELELMDHDLKCRPSLGRVDSLQGEVALRNSLDLLTNKHKLGERVATAENAMADNSLVSDVVQPVVCRWPTLERLAKFGSDDLDSKSAFVFITPTSFPEKVEAGVLYLWVGRLFNSNECKYQYESNLSFGGQRDFDWKYATSDVVSRMGLPKDIKIEIIMEKEEPAEFLSLLSSL